MRFQFPHIAIALCVLAGSQLLAGCNTIAGVGRDIQSAGRAVERVGGGGSSEEKESASIEASTSPAAGQSMPAAPASNAVYFTLGSAELSADARRAIDTALADAKGRNPKRVEVIGYTDTVGSPDSNEQLSMRRAQAVADELASQGIPRDIIEVRGRGESNLAVPTGDGVSEARNRRAIIDIEA